MVFRDRWFCEFKECVSYPVCDRAYTEEVAREVRIWWGSDDAPVDIMVTQPACFNQEEEKV